MRTLEYMAAGMAETIAEQRKTPVRAGVDRQDVKGIHMTNTSTPDESQDQAEMGDNGRQQDIDRTAAELVRAKFLQDNAGPKAPRRIAAIAVVLTDPRASDGAKVQYCMRELFADGDTGENSSPGKETLAVLQGKSIRQIHHYDQELERLKYQERRRRKYDTTVFTLLSPSDTRKIVFELTAILGEEAPEVSNFRTSGQKAEDDPDNPEVSKSRASGLRNVEFPHLSPDQEIEKCGFTASRSAEICTQPCTIYPERISVESQNQKPESESAADAETRESAREAAAPAPIEVSFEELKEETRPANLPVPLSQQALAKSSRKRQGSMFDGVVQATHRISDEEVERAFVLLDEAMAGLWKRLVRNSKRKALLRQLIDSQGFGHIEEIAAALRTASFARGDNDNGWIIPFDDLLNEDRRTKLLEGAYDGRRQSKQVIGKQSASASPIDLAIARGADKRICDLLGEPLLRRKGTNDQKTKEVEYLLDLSDSLKKLDGLTDEVLAWAADNIRESLEWRPEIAIVLRGIKKRLAMFEQWKRDFVLTDEEEQLAAQAELAWERERIEKTDSRWKSLGMELYNGSIYTENMIKNDWIAEKSERNNEFLKPCLALKKKLQEQCTFEECAESASLLKTDLEYYWTQDKMKKEKAWL